MKYILQLISCLILLGSCVPGYAQNSFDFNKNLLITAISFQKNVDTTWINSGVECKVLGNGAKYIIVSIENIGSIPVYVFTDSTYCRLKINTIDYYKEYPKIQYVATNLYCHNQEVPSRLDAGSTKLYYFYFSNFEKSNTIIDITIDFKLLSEKNDYTSDSFRFKLSEIPNFLTH